tara:strand:+ start:240 stop:1316 length:1077 start_codon:yes stop_codon:yes gene_type:complete
MVATINENIRYYKANDPYYYEVDNLPLIDLLQNDKDLRDELNLIITNSTAWATKFYVDTAVQSAVGALGMINVGGDGIVVPNNVIDWVLGKGYITTADIDLTSLVTYAYLQGQEYINHAKLLTYGYATSAWVNGLNLVSIDYLNAQLYATQSWVDLKEYATEQWIIDQGYTTQAASELRELSDCNFATPPFRSEGDIMIHNNVTDQFNLTTTAYRTLYTEHHAFNENSTFTIPAPLNWTETDHAWTTATVQWPSLVGVAQDYSTVDYATLLFRIAQEGDSTSSMHYRRTYGAFEYQVCHSYGATGSSYDAETIVEMKVPVISNGGEGKFKFDFKNSGGGAASIVCLAVFTRDVVRVIL